MAGAGSFRFAGLDQPITRVLPDRLEQLIARHPGSFLHVHERTIDKCGEDIEHAFLSDVTVRAHGLYGLDPKTASEHREPTQYDPFLIGQ